MSTVTVVPTVDMASTPPRVRLDVTDTGTSPSIFSTTVTRMGPDGVLRTVRTPDGNPLVLTTSGVNRVGLLYDYEAPYQAAVSYSTQESPGVTSAPVTVTETRPWLIHLGVPSLSMPIDPRAGSFAEETWDVQQGVFWPIGRNTPVVQTDGSRKAAASSVTVAINTATDLADLRDLLADASVLLLNVPPSLSWGVPTSYVSIGQVRNARVTDIGSDPYRAVTLPYQVVDSPIGGSQSGRAYSDLLTFASYSALQAAYANYSAVLAGP